MPESTHMDNGREATSAASLPQILEARDRRAGWQHYLLAAKGSPVLSLTLVSPGPVKDSRGRRLLMDAAEDAFQDRIRSAGFAIPHRVRMDGLTGPEALWVVEAAPEALKRLAIGIEEEKPWGRLLDADVVISDERGAPVPLERRAFGYKPRGCLVCGGTAKACIAQRRHSPREAEGFAEALLLRLWGQP